MKRLLIFPATLGLSAFLSACGGGDGGAPNPPSSSKFALTVNVTGVASAPVKVINTTTKTAIFDGPLTGSKTFGDLAAGSVLSVQGGAVNGYTTPAAQSVTLDSDKSVTVEYQASGAAGTAVSNTSIAGKVVGTDLQLGNAYLGSFDNPFFGKTTLVKNVVSFDLSALVPGPRELLADYYGSRSGCVGNNSDSTAKIYGSTHLTVFGPQGDLLGYIDEKIVAGPDSTLPQATLNRMYSDRPFTYKGSCTYYDSASSPYTGTVDIDIRRGWNTLVLSQEAKAFTTRNAASDDRIELTFTSAEPRVVFDLGSAELNFGDSDSVTVDAEVIQVGNYSGKLSLSTDLPGLTVEPATLTLNPLPKLSAQAVEGRSPLFSALGLRPQKLSTKLTFKYSGDGNVYNRPFSLLAQDSGGRQVGRGSGLISVSRPGITVSVYGPELELAPSSTKRLPVLLTAVGNFSGEVTVSLSGLPAGVSAPASKVNLQYYGSTELTLTSGASVKSGTYPLTVTAQGGGKSATATVNLVVPRPSVQISIDASTQAIAQGEQATIGVDVQSQDGFSGPTTLQLTGLPAGITSAPLVVQVTPNTVTTARVPLTAAADTALGVYRVQVGSSDLSSTQYPGQNTVALTVRPARTALGADIGPGIAASREGVWVAATAYDQGNRTSTIKHVVAGKIKASYTVPVQINKLLTLPDGAVLAMNYDTYSDEVYRVTNDGISAALARPRDLAYGAVDSQGQVWFVQTTPEGIGGEKKELARWNPATGAVTVVTTPQPIEPGGSLTASNDGKQMVYFSAYANKALKINTVTKTISNLNVSAGGASTSMALGNDGLIYFTAYGQLKRLNTDGTVTTFQNQSQISRLVGFDQKDSGLVWALDSDGVVRINAATNQLTSLSLGQTSAATLLPGGGLGVLTLENYFGSGPRETFLSILR